MLRSFAIALIAASLSIVAVFLALRTVYAFEPWNIRLYPGAPLINAQTSDGRSTAMVNKVAETSTATWDYSDSVGWNGVAGVISRALDSGSSDPESLGNVYNSKLARDGRGQLVIRQARADEAADVRHNLVSSAVMVAQCGAEWATACVYLFNPPPRLPAYYKAAAMMVWAERDAKAVFRHEFNHAFTRSCDQYPGGCPRVSDGQWGTVSCTGNPDTLMDCGGAARTATEFDYQTLLLAYPSTAPFLQIVPACDPCWNGERWVFADGLSYAPNAGCGLWYTASNRLWWGDCDLSWGGRWNDILKLWIGKDRAYDPATGEWHLFTGYVPGLF